MAEFTDEVSIRLRSDFLHRREGDSNVNGNRILPPNGATLELGWLRSALQPKKNVAGLVEELIPERIIIREEMETAFKELLHNGYNTLTVFSGSPGIGKSILLFLVALYRVVTKNDKVVYLRRADDTDELVSIFAMEYKENHVFIRFSREVSRTLDAAVKYESLRYCFDGVSWTDPSIVGVADGPKSPEFSRFSKLTYGCTSGGGIRIKHHMVGKTFNVAMGGWKKEDLETAIVTQLKLDPTETNPESTQFFDQEKFDAVYFVHGGRIRGFLQSYQSQDGVDTTFADSVVARVSKQQASLSLSHSDCRSTDEHVDSLRTMFRMANGSPDSVVLHVDSGYMLRKLRTKISGEELFSSYKKAEAEGNKGAQSNYFEEMLHWCFRQEGISPSITQSVHAEGSGTEGVGELTQKNQYWIPSVPNFVNIDSAIVGSDEKVWCYQFTVSRKHSYKKRRLRSTFLNHISFLDETNEVVIVFVVPQGTDFALPDTGGEVETDVFQVNCSALDTVLASVGLLAARVAV